MEKPPLDVVWTLLAVIGLVVLIWRWALAPACG